MTDSPSSSLTPRELANLLWDNRRVWIGTTLVCGALAVAYALVAPRYWDASQALVIRQETAGSSNPRPGKFADLYEMKTLQETILELAKSRHVVAATLMAVERQETGAEPTPPTDEQIEKFRKRMKMLPPDGAEFGKTEVFYFNVKDTNRERAIALVSELCRQLDAGLKVLRTARATSLINELEEEIQLTSETHARGTERLTDFESSVGADLGELRMLQTGSSGQSDLRQEVVQLGREARQFQVQLRQAEKLLALLKAAEDDPSQFVATPNSLLTSQPALRRLKDGLLDAQIATAKVAGTRSADHPRVRAATEAERQIRADLHRELEIAIRGAQIDFEMCSQRYEAAKRRTGELEARLARLADLRAEYSDRVAAVENSRLSLDRARQSLATARAGEAAAQSGSLVTRIDNPETGPYPTGPGRTVIAGAGAVGGLMLGLGWLFLTLVPGTRDSSPRLSGGTAVPSIWPVPEATQEVTHEVTQEAIEPEAEKFAVFEPVAPLPAVESPPPAPAADEWWNAVAAGALAAAAGAAESTPAAAIPDTFAAAEFADGASSPLPAVPVVDATAVVQDVPGGWPDAVAPWPEAAVAEKAPEFVAPVLSSWNAEIPTPALDFDLAESFAQPATASVAPLPRSVGVLPSTADAGFGGMSLEHALAVATAGRS